jgi:hypothetical protein
VTDLAQQDPQGPHWGGLAWSDWLPLENSRAASIPDQAGIYRLRCRGSPKLIYVGISSRLARLRQARLRESKRGHSAAACVAAHEHKGRIIAVSWAIAEGIDHRELMGREVDLIAAHRTRFASSPACQFHGRMEMEP